MRSLVRTACCVCLLVCLSPLASAADACVPATPANAAIPNVDMQKVRKAWLVMYNRVRHAKKLAPYSYDERLNATATEWSAHAEQLGAISHKREADSAYYDYKQIEQWFADQGIAFKNVDSKTFTENIGWGPYDCKTKDCTMKLVSAVRSTLRYFLSEKAKKYRPHYDSVVSDKFQSIGLGVAVDPVSKKYFLTVHYATEVVASSGVVCASAK